jgi:hypothetical protein
MPKDSGRNSVVVDSEARVALWKAICEGVGKLSGQCVIYTSRSADPEARISGRMETPDVQTWQLVEALSLLSILISADRVYTAELLNLFGRTGPVHMAEDGKDRYLWAQPTLTGHQSALGGRPDLVITFNSNLPSADTVLRVVECKCCSRLGAHDIRAEFGKAHDLRASSYLIWSFTTPPQRLVEGARGLGLDLVALGFDTPRRADLIAAPESLLAHVANALRVSRREQHFARTLLQSGQDASRKLLGTR